MVGLPVKVEKIRICSAVSTIEACNRRTDRQTSYDSIVRAMHTRRAVRKTKYPLLSSRRGIQQTEFSARSCRIYQKDIVKRIQVLTSVSDAKLI